MFFKFKNNKLEIVATDLDIVFYDEISELKSTQKKVVQQHQQMFYLIF